MIKRASKISWTAMALCLASFPGAAAANQAAFDKAMAPLLDHYALIHQALSGDSEKGVARAARGIVKGASKLKAKGIGGKHAAHYKAMPKKIKEAAVRLSKAKGIAEQRDAFKALSRSLVLWATLSKPRGVSVVYCSMAKGSWLQKKKEIANPYYGAKMLRCGEIVSGAHKGHADGHMGH